MTNYVKSLQVDKDTTQLLTGRGFENGRSTVSTVGSICGGKAVGISVDIDIFEPHILAANLAHAIGHNLGFRHDGDVRAAGGRCGCPGSVDRFSIMIARSSEDK